MIEAGFGRIILFLAAVIFSYLGSRDNPISGAAPARRLTDISAVGSAVVVS
jgi:hypothetical protein